MLVKFTKVKVGWAKELTSVHIIGSEFEVEAIIFTIIFIEKNIFTGRYFTQ